MVMEASGVYTEPVYYALTELDFTEVLVVNPAHVKALRGHKTDARDAVRMLDLYECGAVMRGCADDARDVIGRGLRSAGGCWWFCPVWRVRKVHDGPGVPSVVAG